VSVAAPHERFMKTALHLAARGYGDVWPNPTVGCVIVDDAGCIVGRGWTQSGGRPHAETEALRRAGARAKGATAYVTLEPCAHHGVTAPCAQSLIDAGIGRVITACEDPDPRVCGKGHAMLRAAGSDVQTGVLLKEAMAANAGFFHRVKRGRPLITLKLATSLDGKIALKNGESRWITGEAARRAAHLLRSRHDAIMVGIGTVLADDPELTIRIAGIKRSRLIRVVADADARLPTESKLATSAFETAVWLLCARDADAARQAALTAKGVRILHVSRGPVGVDLAEAVAALAREGLTRVLVEGGARIAAGILQAHLADRLAWFRSPVAIGADGVGGLAALNLATLQAMPRFEPVDTMRWAQDVLETYEPAT
jgi:diaminohydroxyphosphoribosylaminopyrimidine deaminase/5-amino-6-(5-phosphoribosylamino)uracil reductase